MQKRSRCISLHILRREPSRPDRMQYSIQRLCLRARLLKHSVLEGLAVLPLPVVEFCHGFPPLLLALIVHLHPNPSAIVDPFDLI
jgi:hypothetical protein